MRKKSAAKDLARTLGIHPARGLHAVLKARLISAVLDAVKRKGFTHAEIANRSGIPRSAVTGILNGSLQKVSLDRVLRLVEAVELSAEVRIKDAA